MKTVEEIKFWTDESDWIVWQRNLQSLGLHLILFNKPAAAGTSMV